MHKTIADHYKGEMKMTIIQRETNEMEENAINYLELYLNHLEGYKKYKEEKRKSEKEPAFSSIDVAQ